MRLVLEPLILLEEDRHKVLYLIYYYRYLNGTNLIDLSSTNIITYRVRIRSNIKLVSNNIQKR